MAEPRRRPLRALDATMLAIFRRGHALDVLAAEDLRAAGFGIGYERRGFSAAGDRAVQILRATEMGELLPRIAANRYFCGCRWCAWSDTCWSHS